MEVQVLLRSCPIPLSYEAEGELQVGQVVRVPFRSKSEVGIVWTLTPEKSPVVCKKIDTFFPLYFSDQTLQLIEWLARQTFSPLGPILKMFLPQGVTDKMKDPLLFDCTPDLLPLSEEQQEAFQKIQEKYHTYQTFLLDGVTGSGKTEVYFHLAADLLQNHQRQILILLPEITLTTQWIERFEKRFGLKPWVWHSNVTPAQKRKVWQAVVQGQSCIVVGTRSALFLPFQKLGLIVVDEEHDASYKQSEMPCYQARDVSVFRAYQEKVPVVLASATPSLETFVNATSGRYHHLVLTSRFGTSRLPKIHLIDRRGEKGWISSKVLKEIDHQIQKQEQTALYLNRRGYAPVRLCSQCGYKCSCPTCGTTLTFHQRRRKLLCHYCGFDQVLPEACPGCSSQELWIFCGLGVEKVEEEMQSRFGDRVLVLSSDAISTPKKMEKALSDILDHKVDIIIGTQMLVKGHHFPLLTLVVVLDGDSGLMGPDFRGAERTYQMLHQVAGRAGRAQKPGQVFIQTFTPQNALMHSLAAHNRDQFYTLEIGERETHQMPPFRRIAGLIISDLNPERGEAAVKHMARNMPYDPNVQILGPVEAPLFRLQGRYRWRFLVSAASYAELQRVVRGWIEKCPLPSTVRLTIDVDPYEWC